jgi:hypothetical protein
MAIYPRLPAARAEAIAVADLFENPGSAGAACTSRVLRLISPDDPDQFGADADAVIGTLLPCDKVWRIVHIAGHGEPPERVGAEPQASGDPEPSLGDPRGVVLSDGAFLGPREIASMRVVPELVFVNCCHLAGRHSSEALRQDDRLLGRPYNRAQFAATVAEELIKIGVRCVVAAGWAVDDDAAKEFATTFYGSLLRGGRFIDAVSEAREAAYRKGGNTWAAYQCYGDPDWTFRREAADAQRPARSLPDEFAGVASQEDLRLALETIAINTQYRTDPSPGGKEEQRAKIRLLESRYAEQWGGVGSVAAAFGSANAAVGDLAAAIRWYERALAANDGTAPLKVPEQLGNLRSRLAWDTFDAVAAAQSSGKARRGKAKRGVQLDRRGPVDALAARTKSTAHSGCSPRWSRSGRRSSASACAARPGNAARWSRARRQRRRSRPSGCADEALLRRGRAARARSRRR